MLRRVSRALPFLYLSLLLGEAGVLAPSYVWLRPDPGGIVNVVVGSVALLSMIAMLVYSIARRSRALRSVMRLSTWLHLHIFLGLQGILLAYVHCLPLLWRGGAPLLLNPGMLNLYAVTIVFGSGLFGRYLYAQVPKTLGGQHLAAKELDAELAALDRPVPPEVAELWRSMREVRGMLAAARARRGALRRLRGMALEPEVRGLAERRVVLESQKAAMSTAQRVFRLWIVLHRPVAAAMYLISFVHVALWAMFSTGARF
jgi:hypothetical protein